MKDNTRTLVIGTRGSKLAIAQTKLVADLLKKNNSTGHLRFETTLIKTEGDESSRKINQRITGKDAFTGAIDRALLRGDVDIAVHSLKDVPVETFRAERIEIAAFPKRGSPFDVFISRIKGIKLSGLRSGARIGTSSIRRAIQLKAYRPDLEIVELHGNVPTRIRKLRDRKSGLDLDGIVLAEAGLKRLGISVQATEVLPTDIMLPAVGQGCLAVAVRKDDAFTRAIVSKIDDRDTRLAVSAERAFSKELGGGCNLPIAAHASIVRKRGRKKLVIDGLVEGTSVGVNNVILRARVEGSPKDAVSLGKKLARVLKRGQE